MSSRPGKWNGPIYRRVATTEQVRTDKLPYLELRLWNYARMGPQSARNGCGPFSPARAAEELECTLADVTAAMGRLCVAMAWTFDPRARWLLIPEALAVSWDGSPAQLIGYRREIERQSPPSNMLRRFDAIADQIRTAGGLTLTSVADSDHPAAQGDITFETTAETSTRTTGGTSPQTTGGLVQGLVQGLELVQGHEEQAPSPSAPAVRPEDLVAAWNELTEPPIPKCRELTASRAKNAAARLRDRGLTVMRNVFAEINASPLCRGEVGTGWVATIDWALKPSTIVKVLEGNYRQTSGATIAGRTGPAPSGKYAALEADPSGRRAS